VNPNPVTDIAGFLTRPGWMTAAFWFLLIASLASANYVVVTIPWQRRFSHVAQGTVRLLVGVMWWQQSLWKLPPYYTDHPEQPFGETGLAYWMTLMGKHAAIPLQADFVNNVVLPNFYLFAPVVYGLEVLTAASLMLGLFVRLFAVVGALQVLILWLGLYSAPGEWPWTCFFPFLLMLVFALQQFGRSLGIDAILAARRPARFTTGIGRRLFDAVT
jgi:thiosulfate dehydrogenase [quinone] large subunit